MTILRDLSKALGSIEIAREWLNDIIEIYQDIINEGQILNNSITPYWDGIANNTITLVYIVNSVDVVDYYILTMDSYQFQKETESDIGFNDVITAQKWLDVHKVKIVASGSTTIKQISLNA